MNEGTGNTPAADFDVVVVGGGPAGLGAALAIASTGARTALAAQPHRPVGERPDTRTAALFPGSIAMLDNLGVWPAIKPLSAQMRAIRLIDDRDALLRAPEVLFQASEIGEADFGYNVPNAPLVAALDAYARAAGPPLTMIDTAGVTDIAISPTGVELTLAEGGKLTAKLVAGADGRRSLARSAAGISVKTWTYEQSALTTVFTHTRPHGGISTEFHRAAGPCTVVPMPSDGTGHASSLVWVERPAEAERLAALDEAAFHRTLETRLKGLLGTVQAIGPRSVFPLSGLAPDRFGLNRVALVGEAAHVVPPIGAQGLNLGLRDGAALADCVRAALKDGRDVGGAETLAAYDAARRADVTSRVWSIDLLNTSLLSPLLPVHLARGAGLVALKMIGPLRRLLVREGLQPSFAEPALMRRSPRAA